MTDVTDAPGGEIPEEVVKAAADTYIREAGIPRSHTACMRAALFAAGVGRMVGLLEEARELIKERYAGGHLVFHTEDQFLLCSRINAALSSFTGTRT